MTSIGAERQKLTRLRKLLVDHFDLEELKVLCFDLGVEYEELVGKTRITKMQDLITHLQRRGELQRLVDAAASERPNVNWPDMSGEEPTATADSYTDEKTGPEGMSRHIIDFASYITDKTSRFVGRRFVFSAFDQFLQENQSGYFVIRGDPGIGKSAVMARIVQERGYLHHFNIAVEGLRSAQRFLSNICAQLILRHGLPARPLSFSKDTDAGMLRTLLQEAAEQSSEPIVLIVDALDEAETPDRGANPLRLPTSLPQGTYIIVSTRRTDQTLELSAERYRVLELEANSDGNLADVGAYIRAFVAEEPMTAVLDRLGISRNEFEKRLTLKSEGNFMYLRHVLPAIRNGVLADLAIGHIPKGLQGYYEYHWNKMRGEDFDRFVDVNQPIIATLATAHQPISLRFCSKVTGLKMAEVQWTIERWNEFLHKITVEDGPRYRIYHASYRDFLATRVAG